jgi:uncharacterized membrane protein
MGNLDSFGPSAQGAPATVKSARPRIDSVDLVRGLVMVIMALDHVRDFLAETFRTDPVDIKHTFPLLFFTRWITHFCAPTFTFLAGTGSFLAGARGMTRTGLSWFLFSRGLWLVILELTWIHLSWNFSFIYDQGPAGYHIGAGTLWSIGWSMVILSGLCFLPTSVITVIGVAIVAFHNLFDGVKAAQLGWFGQFWGILHSTEEVQLLDNVQILPRIFFQSGYAVLPWTGALCCGYGLGALITLDRQTRRPQLIGLGLALTALFVGLRYTNFYGDLVPVKADDPGAGPWSVQDDWVLTICSFLNCQKYPPSLLYLLMTLGPAITLIGIFDHDAGPIGKFFIIFGRVPLFYYLLHIPLIHAIGIAIDYYRFGHSPLADNGFWNLVQNPDQAPANYGISLFWVYVIWIGVVLGLYPLCYWFAGIKQRYRARWLSYF